MPLMANGALDPPVLSTLQKALDWDGRMHRTGMLKDDGVLNDELVEQLKRASSNAAAATWDKTLKASPTVKVPPASDEFFAFHGALKGGPVNCVNHTIRCSLEKLAPYLLEDVECEIHVPVSFGDIFDVLEEKSAVEKEMLHRWVFTCSYNRAASACLDREKTMHPLQPSRHYVQVLVVRKNQVEAYASKYSGSYVIAALPERMAFQYEPGKRLELDVKSGGIGYARLFCQLLAHSLGLREIWMLDDNVRRTYELRLDGERGTPTIGDNGAVKLKPCSFDTVMSGIEQITRRGDENEVMDPKLPGSRWFAASALGARFTPLPANTKFRPDLSNQAEAGWGKITQLSEYTGATNQYGVIGMQRDSIQQERGFKVTHSVYSFFLLNIAATVERGCFYPARPIWEDIEFLHLLDEAELAICKVSKYVHRKAHTRGAAHEPRPPQPLPPPPPPPKPTLEQFLQHLEYSCRGNDSMPPNDPLSTEPVDTSREWLSASMEGLLLQCSSDTPSVALLPLQPMKAVPSLRTGEDTPVLFSHLLTSIRRWARRNNVDFVVLLVQHVDVMEVDDTQQGELVHNVSGLTRESVETYDGTFEKLDGFEQDERFLFEENEYFAIRFGAGEAPVTPTAGTKHKAGPSSDEPSSKASKLSTATKLF